MDNSLLAVRDINHIIIVVGDGKSKCHQPEKLSNWPATTQQLLSSEKFSGFYCKSLCQEKISPISVKMKNSETECLRNHGKSPHAGTLASGYFCKYLCQEQFSDMCVNFEKSQTEHFSN